MKKLHPRLVSVLKYIVAICLLTFVLGKVDLEQVKRHFSEISIIESLAALVLVTIAQFAAALRMRYFFKVTGYAMTRSYSVILYYVGAFYNFLLPGGIGGDAYKIILARKRMHIHYLQGTRIMVADRASGLCVLLMMMFLGLFIIGAGNVVPFGNALLAAAAVIVIITYLIASKILLKQQPQHMAISLAYSAISQLFWTAVIVWLCNAVGEGDHIIPFITLYCAAGIASLLPVTVGGLGIKEMTYVYGANQMQQWLGLSIDPNICVALSLFMFILMFVSALPGLLWLNKAALAKISHADEEPQNG